MGGEPKGHTGSGFFVSRDVIVTNFHVIDGCRKLAIRGKGVALVQAIDAKNDLALLKTDAGSESTALLRDGRLRTGEQVTAVGYPLSRLVAQEANVTTGNISALAGPHNDDRLVQITAPVQPGNSGGPVLDASGNVAGVVVSGLDTLKLARATGAIAQNVNFAIKGSLLRTLLDSNGIEYKSTPLQRALPTADVAERAQQFTVLVECSY